MIEAQTLNVLKIVIFIWVDYILGSPFDDELWVLD